jgi:catechol 2,3-dioxygenase-like lactoylglutathione lyase family enzyme
MKIEHFALQVEDPVAMAEWYVKNLGMNVVRSGGAPANARFLADSAGHVMLEIYRNPSVKAPDYRTMDPLLVHVCFVADDVAAVQKRLLAAGACAAGDIFSTPEGDDVVILRDPWGLSIQFARRKTPLV